MYCLYKANLPGTNYICICQILPIVLSIMLQIYFVRSVIDDTRGNCISKQWMLMVFNLNAMSGV